MDMFICEKGCRYTGGSSFFASTSYLNAWKAMHKARFESGDYHIKLIAKDYWESEKNYFVIRKVKC